MGISPIHAMQIAERLYTQGYISYPRTETSQYPSNFDLRQVLSQQTKSSAWGALAKSLLDGAMEHPRKGTDQGDHPPITPTAYATQEELGGDAYFIATVFSCRMFLFWDSSGSSFLFEVLKKHKCFHPNFTRSIIPISSMVK